MRHQVGRLFLILALVGLSACSSSTPELHVGEGPLTYVVMGNSMMFLPTGASVIDQYETMLAEDFEVEIDTRDHTVPSQAAEDLLFRLENSDTLRNDLAEADVVMFVLPFNEWAEPLMTFSGEGGRDPAECGGDDNQQCLRDTMSRYTGVIDQIFAEIMSIVDPTEQVIMVQDFYKMHTERQTEAAALLHPYFEEMQVHTRQNADQYGIPVARVWDDFMGDDGDIPNLVESGLIQADGVHPTEVGAMRIAELYHDLGYQLSN